MNHEKFYLWKQRLNEFGRLNQSVPKIVKTPSVGSEIEYYYLSIQIPFGLYEIEFSQGVHIKSDNIRYSKITFSHNFENNQKLDISLSRSDFFDFLLSRNIFKTGSKEFDKVFTLRTNDRRMALLIFREIKVQELFLKNELLIFNLRTTKSGVTTVLLKCLDQKLYSLSELMQLLESFTFIIGKIRS